MTSFTDHSVKTDEELGRRFVRALTENGDSKSDVLRNAIIRYVEQTEGRTVESIERQIAELEAERDEYEEKSSRAEREAAERERRIEDLREILEDLRSEGDHDELFEEVRNLAASGADLRVINDKTGKLDKLRKLGNYESVDAVIKAVEEAAGAGGSDE